MNANVYVNLAIQMFQRSNPIGELVSRFYVVINMLLTYKSNVKLNKYRHSLYMQQLKRMEGFIVNGSPYTYRGNKMDRKF